MSDKSKPAFPKMGSPDWRAEIFQAEQKGMTLREYAVIKLAAAWVVSLSRRHDQKGYTDEYCGYEANRLAIEQADALIAELQREAGDE